jgi:hypothetical protein
MKSSIGMGSMITQGKLRSRLPAFEATPPRRPMSMPRQTMDYWTPRAVIVSLLQGMTEELGPHRALRHVEIPVPHDDE